VTEIVAGSDLATIITVFETTLETQATLLEHLRTGTQARTLTRAGFVSANFHASEDGLRVVIYAQWESVEAWQTYMADAEVSAGGAWARNLAPADSHVYVVDSVYEATC
jgi:quinol monooxygenase YgiN